jgi:hypothetical protein
MVPIHKLPFLGGMGLDNESILAAFAKKVHIEAKRYKIVTF